MNKITREEFLKLPAGVVYLEQSGHDIGPAIKGPTGENGSFQKTVARPTGTGRVEMRQRTQTVNDQADFQIFDEVETMTAQALIFEQIGSFTPAVYQAAVLRLIETFLTMPNIRIQLPDGRTIKGDGTEIEATAEGSSSVN